MNGCQSAHNQKKINTRERKGRVGFAGDNCNPRQGGSESPPSHGPPPGGVSGVPRWRISRRRKAAGGKNFRSLSLLIGEKPAD